MGDVAELSPEPKKLPECFRYDAQICARWFPGTPWIMAHFHLVDPHSEAVCLSQDLGVDHRPDRTDLHSIEH
jgi:hypothetical protein